MKPGHLISGILLACMAVLAPCEAMAAGRAWEQVRTGRSNARSIVKDTEVEVKTAPSTIIITVSRAMNVKVYTILGQLVSSETLQPGTSQLHISGHGVYIVKIGSLTCKVAL